MKYSPSSSPLHAARAWIAAGYCLTLLICVLVINHPLWLGFSLILIIAVAINCGVAKQIIAAGRASLFLAVMIAFVNILVAHQGNTVLVDGYEFPIFGKHDITLEAIIYGGFLAERVLTIGVVCALYTSVVNPDGILKLFRRFSFHSALTATLATRLLPALGHDLSRFSAAQRSVGYRKRQLIVKAVLKNSVDRALDIAATLELRGFGLERGKLNRRHMAWSRHDIALVCSIVLISLLIIGVLFGGFASFDVYPHIEISNKLSLPIAGLFLWIFGLFPFIFRRGITVNG